MSESTSVLEAFQLSPLQARLWRLNSVAAQRRLNHCELELIGSLDLQRLSTAVAQVVSRHEVLRTALECFPDFDLPLQFLRDPDSAWQLRCVDLHGAERMFGQVAASAEPILEGCL